MEYILGIDTGGTNTDCAVVEQTTGACIYSSKALTTKQDLSIGIRNAVDALDFRDYDRIVRVCLSTTLATNAVVEGTSGSVGLILSGSGFDLPEFPAIVETVSGKIDIRGTERVPLSKSEVGDAIERLVPQVDALAVSSYASVRNPIHELTIRDMITRQCDLPVFCAHELSGTLGFQERTVTTVLNAGLLRIVRDFIHTTKEALRSRGIYAPIAIVRSDGSLMNESVALSRPIDMILSGPAASILGVRHLTNVEDAIILDMGGTTSDIAHLSGGTVRLDPDGARVGGWQTHCRSASVSTFGIGGDSICRIERSETSISPTASLTAVAPVNASTAGTVLAAAAPVEADVIRCFVGPQKGIPACRVFAECASGQPSSVTLTDLLEAAGDIAIWDSAASVTAIRQLAASVGLTEPDTISLLRTAAVKKLTFALLQSGADFDGQHFNFFEDPASRYLFEKSFAADPSEFLGADFHLKLPIIAVGGPVAAWLPPVAERLHTELIIPEYHEVANAIGAAVTGYSETAEALIRPVITGTLYTLYLPGQKMDFTSLKEAIAHAETELTSYVQNKMLENGINDCPVSVGVEDIYTEIFTSGKKIYVETKITAEAHMNPVIR